MTELQRCVRTTRRQNTDFIFYSHLLAVVNGNACVHITTFIREYQDTDRVALVRQ